MTKEKVITTDRLILREWESKDLEPFAALNADPLVREYFSSTLNRQESDRIAKLISDEIDKNGYGFWAISVPNVSDFVGFVGIRPVDFEAHFGLIHFNREIFRSLNFIINFFKSVFLASIFIKA
jgi:3-dehydroquinate dehydratase / shikimate dehydrogenase